MQKVGRRGKQEGVISREQEADRIAERRLQVVRLHARNHSNAKIAVMLGVNEATVSRDLAALRAERAERIRAATDEMIERELAELQEMEMEAWEAWERSKEDGASSYEDEATETKEYESAAKDSGKGKAKAGVMKIVETLSRSRTGRKVSGRLPASEYLRVIQWCIDKRCELLNLNPAKKVAMTDPSGVYEYGSTDEERRDLVRKMFDALVNEQKRTPREAFRELLSCGVLTDDLRVVEDEIKEARGTDEAVVQSARRDRPSAIRRGRTLPFER